MAPRRYEMGERARAAAETRRKIVEATFALHAAQGIAETTMKQIAERADVGLGTVYHHFPTYDDAVRACGAYTFELTPPPTAELLEGATDLPDRVGRLVRSLFAFYERCPGLARARADRQRIAALQDAMTELDREIDGLVAATLRPLGRSARRDAVAAALLDYEVYRRLAERGMATADAAKRITGVLVAWLVSPQEARKTDQRKPRSPRP